MSFKSPEEELEEFLAKQPSWLRKILQFDVSLSTDELQAWVTSNWLQEGGKIDDEYVRLLQRVPAKWREYRKRREQNALRNLSAGRPGRPRKDAMAEEALQSQSKGKSHAQIAAALNRKYGPEATTREAVRKLLSRKRRSSPDKT